MKIKFENLEYQDQAISSVINLFKKTNYQDLILLDEDEENDKFTGQLSLMKQEKNKLDFSDKLIEKNFKEITEKNNIYSKGYKSDNKNRNKFEIEMETGTGKTFVFLKTIFELNKEYGLKKFVILVPGIAIREGIRKTIQQTEEYFLNIYNKRLDFFVWNSSNPSQLKDFSQQSSDNVINVMITTIQSLRSTSKNVIHMNNETFQGDKPIEYLQRTKPVIIVDEPQKTTSSEAAKKVIDEYLNPLFVLSYSATHKEIHNLVYRLTAKDAYDKRLVKRINIKTPVSKPETNQSIQVLDIVSSQNSIKAKLSINVKDLKSGEVRSNVGYFSKNDDLYLISNNNVEYEHGYIIEEIVNNKDQQEYYVKFANGKILYKGGNIVDDSFKRSMIRALIEKHLECENRLNKKGIKVLSLFFIDEVKRYRYYEGNEPFAGDYAEWFEEIYLQILNDKHFDEKYPNIKEEYKNSSAVSKFHGGYFAQDKNNKFKEIEKKLSDEEETAVFDLILKDKEKLLSFSTPLRFIFSHSALKEGWDNPNVFNICVLKDTPKNEINKRQEIGRGLRLCVDQNGDRVKDEFVNQLTVVSSDVYSEFAEKLQNEFKEEIGKNIEIKVTENLFVPKEIQDEVLKTLVKLNFVENGSATKQMYDFYKSGKTKDFSQLLPNLNIDESLNESINNWLISELNFNVQELIKDDDANKKPTFIQQGTPTYDKVWNIIDLLNSKHYFTYHIDTEWLIKQSIEQLKKKCEEFKVKNIHAFEEQKLEKYGSTIQVGESKRYSEYEFDLLFDYKKLDEKSKYEFSRYYDEEIIKYIGDKTLLTFRTIDTIIKKSGTLNPYFYINKKFYKQAALDAILSQLQIQMSNNLKYEFNLDESNINKNKLIDSMTKPVNEFDKNVVSLSEEQIKNSVSLLDVYKLDSANEVEFVKMMLNTTYEENKIKSFTKLPELKTKVPTGTYSPDWLVLKETEKGLVLETKAGFDDENLKESEKKKIEFYSKFLEDLLLAVKQSSNKMDINLIFDALKPNDNQISYVLKHDYRNLSNYNMQTGHERLLKEEKSKNNILDTINEYYNQK